jgi:peptidoglycan/LPS O-acetylase OafA/YrhL
MTTRIPYRPEVDGLRALAIVAVVLYHIGFAAFEGGFVGVDCFFVISGYLIFSLLYREQADTGAIDWKAFYARRITRLLPEATVLIVVVVVVGYFILLPTGPTDGEGLAFRRSQLAQSGAAGSLWIANFHYWQFGSGYFAPWSGREPLIHLWSLGVEEQFYVVVPLLFWLTNLLTRTTGTRWLVSAGALLVLASIPSIALAVHFAGKWSAFYLLPTRAYEFAVGAALALWLGAPGQARPSQRTAAGLAWLGFVGICASIVWLKSDAFPGAWALIPTISTAALIYGTTVPNAAQSALACRPVVYVGRISYGWYLWHWPILVLWREYSLYSAPQWTELLACGAAAIPAALGYHWVAKLRRFAGSQTVRPAGIFRAGAAAVALSLAVCLVGLWAAPVIPVSAELRVMNARMHDGLPKTGECLKERFDPKVALAECAFGDLKGSPTVVLWGDSHAAAWLPGIDALLEERRARGIQRILFACPAGFVADHPTSDKFDGCNLFNRAVLEELSARSAREPLIVIIAGRWAGYVNPGPLAIPDRGTMPPGWAPGRALVESGLRELIAELQKRGIPVGITHSVPELRYSAPICLYRWPAERCGVRWEAEAEYLRPAVEMIAAVSASHGLPVLDPVPLLCTKEQCRVSVNGLVLYWDDDHLSRSAMNYLRTPMSTFIDTLIQQQARAQPTAALR